jgi:isoquinoline 1-oxidoreductase subunit alpha
VYALDYLAQAYFVGKTRPDQSPTSGEGASLLSGPSLVTDANTSNESLPMTSAKLSVNGTEYTLPEVDGVTLQFALRDDLGLTGTKFGCGMSQCGACMVRVDGAPVTSCRTPVASVLGKDITTIEGLGSSGTLHPLQQAWIDVGVPQCGYCQSGQLISAAAFLNSNPRPSEAEIRQAMNFHLCRCGTYNRIVQAIQLAATRMAEPT